MAVEMNRRAYLSVSLSLSILLVSGRSERTSDEQKRESTAQEAYNFGRDNESQEFHSFSVRIGDGPDEYVHQERFELDGEPANEDVRFDGSPVRLFVTVDSEEERAFLWPVSHAGSGGECHKNSKYYDPTRRQKIQIYG
jgi:hypothetical protein